MSEQAQKVRNEAIPEEAQGLYYNKGLFSEVLAYYDDEALYIEHRGYDGGVVRFSFDMLLNRCSLTPLAHIPYFARSPLV